MAKKIEKRFIEKIPDCLGWEGSEKETENSCYTCRYARECHEHNWCDACKCLYESDDMYKRGECLYCHEENLKEWDMEGDVERAEYLHDQMEDR